MLDFIKGHLFTAVVLLARKTMRWDDLVTLDSCVNYHLNLRGREQDS